MRKFTSALLTFCFLFSFAEFARAEQVTWTNAVGVSVSGNSLTKTATLGWGNSGAASTNVIRDGHGFVEFTATETNTRRMLGLSKGDADQTSTEIDFGIVIAEDTNVHLYENNVWRGAFGTYSTNTRFRIEVLDGVVRYFKNGTLLYTSTVVAAYPLRVDTALYSNGATLTNVQVGNLVWAAPAGVSIAEDSLSKTGTAGWNAGAVSTETIEYGDGSMEFIATETNKKRIAGLATGTSVQSSSNIEFGIQLNGDATVEVVESGTSRGSFGGYAANDVLRVEVRAGTVTYYRNGSSLYTSSVTPVLPLRAAAALYDNGATITRASLETLIWSNTAEVTVSGTNLTKTTTDGWTAHASSTFELASGDGWVEFTAIETDKRRVAGLKGSGAASDYTGLDFAIDLNASGVVQVWESGTSRGTYGSYTHGDRLRVEIQDGTVKYRKNGVVIYTSTVLPTYPLHAEAALYSQNATLVDVAMGDVVWVNETKVIPTRNGVVANASVSGWDSGAVSTKQINSGRLDFTINDAISWRIIGLSSNDSNVDWTDVDFGIMFRSTTGGAWIYESGNYRGAWTFGTGDRFRIEVLSSVVKYYKNGTLIYTSGVTPTLPLRVDTSFAGNGASIFSVAFVGTAVTTQLSPPGISPGAGTYNNNINVTLSHWLQGVTIRYTTDGTDPTTSSTVYSTPIAITQSQTLKAKVWKESYNPSNVATAIYIMKVATPGISPGGGTYNVHQNVSMTMGTAGAAIRYTTDGSTPTAGSTLYTGPVSVTDPLTVKAKGFLAGWTDSDVQTATYSFKVGTPTFTPGAGSYASAQNVAITSVTPSVTFRYTLDGTDPTATSPTVTGGSVTIDRSNTLKVRGFRSGWTTSDPRHATYMITLGTVATPSLSPTPGTFTSQPNVTISTSTTGATIRYTTDGTDPTFKSRIYTGPFPVASTASIKAKAFKSDMTASGTATGLYVVDLGTVDIPRLSPGSGTYATYQTVTVTTETSGATIHYTTNGTDPTETDPTVASGGTINVNSSMTLRVKAWKTGVPPSDVGHGDYHLTGAVAAGGGFTVGLKADGTLWSWGTNADGRTGLGTTAGLQTTPSQITGTDFVAIGAGSSHAVAIKRNGTVWAWGKNANGQIGDGTTTMRTQPVQVSTLTNVVAVAAGDTHSLALKNDGTVWAWGNDNINNYGASPVQVSGLKGISVITAGRNHNFALQTDGEVSGSVWVWGYNDLAPVVGSATMTDLGDGTLSHQATPTRVVSMTNVVDVNTSWNHTFALKIDGTVWAWGYNNIGQMGDNSHIQRDTPVQTATALNPVDRIVAVTSGGSIGVLLQRKRTGDSVVWTWGYNWYGGLGRGNYDCCSEVPIISLMTGAWSIMTGSSEQVAAIHMDGKVWTWGYNANGEVGDGTTTNRATPAAIASFSLVDNSWLSTDSDGDGLSAWQEIELGSDPGNVDSNGDGIPDNIAVSSGKSATNPDMDGDGVPNAKEIELGTDPFIADSDADTFSDGIDCFPTDPSRHTCPASNPSDTTPPTINLITPTNAVLTGTTPPP